jgi:lantibiotic modifying enzyme
MSQLYHAIRDPRYGRLARSAFEYENCYFDAKRGNWIDLRQALTEQDRAHGATVLASFSNTWCYGAPGIALSRLRASEGAEEDPLHAELLVALGTSAASLRQMIGEPVQDFSLCHGAAGIAEVVHEGVCATGRSLGGEWEILNDVVSQGFTRYVSLQRDFPCGTRSGATPSLMLGTAGIGHFYLRVGAIGVPSVLLPDRTEWLATPRVA